MFRQLTRLANSLAAAILFIGVPVIAHAQQTSPPVYAVLSLVGDQLGIVQPAPRPELNFAPYQRSPLYLENQLFDQSVVNAAGIAIRKIVPNAELAALNTRSPVLYEKQASLFEESAGAIAIPQAIKNAAQQQNASYLVLVTKHRDDLSLRFDNHRRDNGKLEGIGFYMDDASPESSRARGFVAPYAYLRVALIDAKTWNVLSRQTIIASTNVPAGNARNASRQWGTMTPEEKARAVDNLLRAEVGKVIPLLLKTG
ncbi:MAG: hypothetical protein ABI905_00645 [Betaproteobacteria bacterium]